MARTSLPPGFRFHPTDVELVMYYLKRKVLGKKHFEAISEANIYKFSPWDLPDKSCLKSKDLEWFFFCPREKKYASGVRVNRAAKNGYWKTTGKDRPVCNGNITIGTVKTLVFHLGHPPQGERTDWVIHEYRILDEHLAAAGVQDTYVLCKVFKKNGLGPKNGAQYGAPFNEADWADDVEDVQNPAISFPSDNALGMVSVLPEMQSSVITGMFDLGSTSGLSLTEVGPSSSAGCSTNEVLTNESGDEIVCLLSSFTDDHTFPFNENGNHEDDLLGNGKDMSVPCFDGNDIYNGLSDLEHWALMKEGRFGSGVQIDGYPLNDMLPQDNLSYIELSDLMVPLNCSAGVSGTEQLILDGIVGAYSHENMPGGFIAGMAHYDSCVTQQPVLPEGSNKEDGFSDGLQMVNDQFDMECNASFDVNFIYRQPVNGEHFPQDMEIEI